jgi:hypothetical protein
MSDLSSPPVKALPSEAAAACTWPTPDVPGYTSPGAGGPAMTCAVEGLNGSRIEGQLVLFDPAQGVLRLRLNHQRRPLPLRLDQFRRMQLTEPLAAPVTPSALEPFPFTVTFKGGAPDWQGHTVSHREEDHGLFLFEPIGLTGTLRRWFVPRAAYIGVHVGMRLGEALIAQHSATPEQIREALAEQEALRSRKLGDILIVRQIITAEELASAVEEQARMPMVRIGQALTALGFVTEAQLAEALAEQDGDRRLPLGELLVTRGVISRADLQTALARKMGYPLVDVLQFAPDAEAVTRLPYAVALRVPALPLMMRAGRLVVAVEDPSNRAKLDEIEFAAQCKLVPVLARAGVLPGAIERAYEKVGATDLMPRMHLDANGGGEFEAGDASKLLASMERGDSGIDDQEGHDLIEQSDNSLVRLINSMILEAHTQGV